MPAYRCEGEKSRLVGSHLPEGACTRCIIGERAYRPRIVGSRGTMWDIAALLTAVDTFPICCQTMPIDVTVARPPPCVSTGWKRRMLIRAVSDAEGNDLDSSRPRQEPR